MFALYVLNIKEFLKPKRISDRRFSTKFKDIFVESCILYYSKKEKFSHLIFKNDIYSASYFYPISKNCLLLTMATNSPTRPLRDVLPYEPEKNILIEDKINEIELESSGSWFLFKKSLKFPAIKTQDPNIFNDYYLSRNKTIVTRNYFNSIQTINLKAILEEMDTNIIRLL